MLKKFGFKKAEARESEARIKLQKELFAFNKCVEHGFPHKPSALAYDPLLKLIAIGTKNGVIRVLGAPGVEFTGEHKEDVSVTKLLFLPEQARLISLCGDNSLHLWEINFRDGHSYLDEVKEFKMEASNKLMTISACCLTADAQHLLMGTEGGNIYLLDVTTFQQSDQIIYQDVVMQNVPDDFKVNPGAVEAIAQQPTDPNKFLIGYNRGLVVLWDNKESNADQTYNATQQLEAVSWHRDGTQFMSAHADGSYIIWGTSDSTKPKEQANTPYGPFPCKAITKVQWRTAKAEQFIIFSGGMPRASYGDRHTVSVTQGAKQVVYDFTSRVVDFQVLTTSSEMQDSDKMEYDNPHSLIVLAEEEIVAIDLQSEGWPCFKQPYLCSLHSSAITCSYHVSNVPEQLWSKIVDAGEAQMQNFSSRDWPIWGGKDLLQPTGSRDLFLTGHEDGTVRFWDASTVSLHLMYKLSTAALFGEGHVGDHGNQDEEEWPPFRKVGTFDPYSDDPRLGIQKVVLCPNSETLVVGGTAGQVVVLQFEREEREQEVKVVTVNIVGDRDNFVWKAHDPLSVRGGDQKFSAGFQPSCVMQLQPPATCTALAVHSEWQLVAAGTGHGFGVLDYAQKKEVTTKCTLNPNDLTGAGESAMSRHKSLKKSLRESFRRLRKRRSERQKRAAAAKAEEKKTTEPKTEQASSIEQPQPQPAAEGEATQEATPAAEATTPSQEVTPAPQAEAAPAAAATPTQEVRTIERAVEARSADDGMVSMVRSLYFADTFLINAQNHTPTLWAGTNAGTIFVYQITVPSNDKRDTEAVTCQLGKEIHLKHRAPVYSICIIDRTATPLPGPLEVQNERARAPDMTGNHQVVICSEEQFKIFSLPNLKPQNKFKLTASEGSKVRKVGFINFRSRSDENYGENDLAILTNQGDLQVFTIPHLRRQSKNKCIAQDNVNGIASCVFTGNGEGYYQPSPSEYIRFSLSARVISEPKCEVELKEGMRPVPVEPVVEQEAAQQEAAAVATEEQPAVEGEKPEGGAAEGDKAEEQAPAEGANDSLALGDLTIDSVKVHLSDDTSTHRTQVIESSRVVKTVVKRTLIQESSTEGGTTVVSSETTTVQEMSSSGDAAGGASSENAVTTSTVVKHKEANLDDDTKMTKAAVETSETEAPDTPVEAEPLAELRITEEGDDDQPTATSTPVRKAPKSASDLATVGSATQSVVSKTEKTVIERSEHSSSQSWTGEPEGHVIVEKKESQVMTSASGAFGTPHEEPLVTEVSQSPIIQEVVEGPITDKEVVVEETTPAVVSETQALAEEVEAHKEVVPDKPDPAMQSAAEAVAEATSLSAIESAMEALATEMSQIEENTEAELVAADMPPVETSPEQAADCDFMEKSEIESTAENFPEVEPEQARTKTTTEEVKTVQYGEGGVVETTVTKKTVTEQSSSDPAEMLSHPPNLLLGTEPLQAVSSSPEQARTAQEAVAPVQVPPTETQPPTEPVGNGPSSEVTQPVNEIPESAVASNEVPDHTISSTTETTSTEDGTAVQTRTTTTEKTLTDGGSEVKTTTQTETTTVGDDGSSTTVVKTTVQTQEVTSGSVPHTSDLQPSETF